MLQGIIDFWDNNTAAIVVVLIGAVAAAVAAVALQKAPRAFGKAIGWLWGKLHFRKQASLLGDSTLTIEETFDKQLEALQQGLESAQTDDEKHRIRMEMGQVAEAKAAYYQASRELSLPQDVREHMEALANRRETTAEARIPQELPGDPEELAELYRSIRQDLLQAVSGFREYSQAVDQHPDDAGALSARAAGLSLAGRYEESLADYNRSLDLRPEDPDTLYNRGTTLDDLERYEEALADFNRSLDLRPDDPDTLSNRGATLSCLERYEEALADFNLSLDLRPDDPGTLNNRSVALDHLERYEEALAASNRSLNLRPDDPGALSNRGLALQHLERYEEAQADYNHSLELCPDHPNTQYNVACLFSLTGRYEESLHWLNRSIIGDSKLKEIATEDEDFAPLRDHPEFGPQFHQLVAGNSGEADH